MDQRERAGDPYEAIRAALDGRQTTIWTALPGIVQSYDAVAQTCVVQPALQGRNTNTSGHASFVNIALCLDCPVVFPGGGGVTLTLPIKKGDECLLVFSSRCIDAWWQQGGVQPPMEVRMHDLSDGFVLPGVRSQPRRLTGVSTTHAQLRSDDGTTYVDLDPTGAAVKIKATGGITLDGNVAVTGNVAMNGSTVTHGGVNIGKDHVHAGVQAGGSNTAVPH